MALPCFYLRKPTRLRATDVVIGRRLKLGNGCVSNPKHRSLVQTQRSASGRSWRRMGALRKLTTRNALFAWRSQSHA
jgi:hypothetical protein